MDQPSVLIALASLLDGPARDTAGSLQMPCSGICEVPSFFHNGHDQSQCYGRGWRLLKLTSKFGVAE